MNMWPFLPESHCSIFLLTSQILEVFMYALMIFVLITPF
jgi:hypothetical protein